MTARPRSHGGGADGAEGGGSRPRRGFGGHAGAGSVHQAEATVRSTLQAGRPSGSGGTRRVTGPDPNIAPVEVTVVRKPFMPKTEFRRKMGTLQQLGDDGKLYKATNPVSRDRSVTDSYRQDMIRRIHEQYHQVNPDFSKALIRRTTAVMQPDHVWELQLGGPDHRGNLRFLHGPTNQDIGMRQIRPQLVKLRDGTPITIRILDEGD